MRIQRKKEHLENYLRSHRINDPLFSDIYIEHNALPLLNLEDIDTSTEFLDKKISYPLMINAMTGGGEFAKDINRQLAQLACRFSIPMAVGSQTVALELGEEAEESFCIVRKEMRDDCVVIANLNGNASGEDAKKAVEMLEANALQIHLNIGQELVMKEGDREFSHMLKNILDMKKNIDVPIIIKEVGNGISAQVASKLAKEGLEYFDISGLGGTNFIEIENMRDLESDFSELYSWGIPTAKAVIDVRKELKDVNIISSGGVRTGTDIVKSLIIGADLAGISGEILSYLIHGGFEHAKNHLEEILYKIKIIMLMLGSKNIEELKKSPYILTGRLKELLN